MKHLTVIALAMALASFGIVRADTNVALAPTSGGTNGGVVIFGYNTGNLSGLGTIYNHDGAGSPTFVNDGSTTGNGADTFGQPNPADGFVGAEFVLSPAQQVNSIVFYGHNFTDGGWFGHNGEQADGSLPVFVDGNITNRAPALTAAGLIAPTVQYTTDGGVTWITDTAVTNDYVAQFAGANANGGASTNPATFTFTTPLTGIDGVRLIGEDGGYASGGGGFLGADEIEVFAGAVPEPSTWAMLLGGAALLGWMIRRRTLRA